MSTPTQTAQALALVNTLHAQLASLARAVVDALKDTKVSPWEGMALGMQGMALGSTLLTLCQSLDPATRQALLTVLAGGQWVLPSDTPTPTTT